MPPGSVAAASLRSDALGRASRSAGASEEHSFLAAMYVADATAKTEGSQGKGRARIDRDARARECLLVAA